MPDDLKNAQLWFDSFRPNWVTVDSYSVWMVVYHDFIMYDMVWCDIV